MRYPVSLYNNPLSIKGYLYRHKQVKHTPNDKKKHICAICGKGFARKVDLQDHQNVHTGAKPHKCKYCSACFASKGTRRTHEKSHLGIVRKK